jgi:hypothetical protein
MSGETVHILPEQLRESLPSSFSTRTKPDMFRHLLAFGLAFPRLTFAPASAQHIEVAAVDTPLVITGWQGTRAAWWEAFAASGIASVARPTTPVR